MDGKMKKGDYKNDIGNRVARREKMYGGGMGMKKRNQYRKGGMTMEGSQPKYDGMPKCMPN
tara:strand:- start:147 stop:329 length:183 start_codon:yes stop_codon:yes gene_type:complete